MVKIIKLGSRKAFSTEEEAKEVLSIIRRITEDTAEKTLELRKRLEWIPKKEDTYERISILLDDALSSWINKVEMLGCEADGLWRVNFNVSDKKYLWQLGDEKLSKISEHCVLNSINEDSSDKIIF